MDAAFVDEVWGDSEDLRDPLPSGSKVVAFYDVDFAEVPAENSTSPNDQNANVHSQTVRAKKSFAAAVVLNRSTSASSASPVALIKAVAGRMTLSPLHHGQCSLLIEAEVTLNVATSTRQSAKDKALLSAVSPGRKVASFFVQPNKIDEAVAAHFMTTIMGAAPHLTTQEESAIKTALLYAAGDFARKPSSSSTSTFAHKRGG